jgi:peptide/nickel transport system substrate-binding protein
MLALATASAGAKELRTNILADPAQIDPITYSELISGDVLQNVYEGLTGVAQDGGVIPGLAESWEAAADNLGFTFHLRPGVKFHSGRPVTAADVKYSFEQLLIPANKGGLAASFLAAVVGSADVKAGTTTDLAGVKAIDDHTVEVRFTEPDVLFPIYPIWVFDRGVIEQYGADWPSKASAGTGPFEFKEWTRGQHVLVTANKDYWGGAPKIDGVDFLIVPDQSTAISQYEAGELDLLYVESVTEGRRILKDPKFEKELIKVPAAQINYLGMNQKLYAPFQDEKVREAICLSIDTGAMVKGLFGGAAFELAGQVAPGVGGANPELPPPVYDPAAAKKLMAEAGFADGKGLPPVKLSTTEPNKDQAQYLVSQFKKVLGMPVEVEIVERATFIKSMNAGEVPFFPWGWSADYPDAMTFLGDIWYGPSKFNRARWQNADYDKLIGQAKAQTDTAKRYALYHEAEKILIGTHGTCPLTVRMQIAAAKPDVHGVALSAFRFRPFADVSID